MMRRKTVYGWDCTWDLIIAAVILAILYFLGNKLQKRQLEQQQMLDAAAQTVSLLVIDKKKLKLTQAGLPKMVVDQTAYEITR